jgi:D-tyrosyl-tRNA(Tyr) deacylase
MKAVIQRVREASVEVDNKVVGAIETGLVVLLGVSGTDEKADADYLAEKIPHLRIFNDSDNKMNLSLIDVKGEILAISQFTLLGNTRKGRRPSFIEAAEPDSANEFYEYFIDKIGEQGVKVEKGIFGAMMLVKIFNDGPVTILLDSNDRLKSRRSA